ncbi:T7SS effector LXG polymorphic toxin [Listeria fleischmannii]|uniref:T7SS effector LXG polymorphic toxin n=1 Tax=Listeria fleischmannii TaxID=1069827 RepID=UPI00162983B1|nr:T7SS effector LXG polymorphic toxin [Listeria fleischmannii]MBC1418211.1 hypothetical protein [Listeria fleischmannii]
MSIDMYLSSSDGQATSTSETCRKQIRGYEELQQAIHDFTTNSASLTGEAYASAKRYFSAVLLPLAQGGMLLSEAVEQVVKKFPADYREQVDSGDLKQTELEEQIRQANQLLHHAENIKTSLLKIDNEDIMKDFQLSQNQVLIGIYQDLKQDLEKKLSKLLAFNTASSAIFKDIAALESAVRQGLAQTKSAWDGNAGVFVVPSKHDLLWTTTIQDKQKNMLDMTSDAVKGVSTASTANVLRAEAKASTKKIKNGTWYKSAVKSTKSGEKTWRQVNGDVNRFKSVKNAKKVDEVINGTGKLGNGTLKGMGALGVAGSLADGVITYNERKDEYGNASAAIDGVVHTGTAVGSIYTGAAIGSLIPIPVVGTVAGAVGGYLVNSVANTFYDGFAHGKWNFDNFKLW